MAKRKRRTTAESIKEKIAAGHGEGRLAEYQPWLRIQDVPSRGLVTRIRGWTTSRVHHLLSLLELRCFYVLDWAPHIMDIREQYPLDLAETLAIAAACGIRHPIDNVTKHPIVFTTDFLVTVNHDGMPTDLAFTVKYENDLCGKRTLEKLEIERRYWKRRHIDWKIITEKVVSKDLARNVEWLHQYLRLEDFCSLPPRTVTTSISSLTEAVSQQNRPLRDITIEIDNALGLEPGSGLALVRHLIATRRWRVDMAHPINPGRPLLLIAKAKTA
jgi:hypothetical protein